jgi:hypothetical protein
MEKIFMFLFILASLIPMFYINKWLKGVIIPRKSLSRLALYFVLILELIFIYTYLLVLVILNLFPSRVQ